MASSSNSLVISRLIPASREEVFRAWTVRDRMNWYCPEDMILLTASADVRVGGSFRASMQGGDGVVHTCYGTYLEIVPNERLVFSHQWEGKHPVETRVTVVLEDWDIGTEVMLKQTGFESAAEAKGHEAGWTSTLKNLENEFFRAGSEKFSQ